jgi:hypothetical protein
VRGFIDLCLPSCSEWSEDCDITWLEDMGCVGGKTEDHDIVPLRKSAELVSAVGVVPIKDEQAVAILAKS